MRGHMTEKRAFFLQVVIGALIVTVIITGMTLWVTAGTHTATDAAVDRVSEFYLKELAERRAQVVSGAIDAKFDQMRRSLALMTPEDLASQDQLRTFIGKMEMMYDLDTFAVVDEDDVVYTRYATYMGGSRYDFLAPEQLVKDEIVSSTSLYGARKQVCLAIPVSDLSFMGRALKACFVQVDIDSIVSTLSFDDEVSEMALGLFYRNGENLTQMDFGPVEAGQNLLETIRPGLDGDTWNALRLSLYDGGPGGMGFSYDGADVTLYYAPIRDTNWVFAVLVEHNIIRDQIRSVGDAMLARSTIQIAVTGLALLAFFGSLVFTTSRNSAALLEKERQHSRDVDERAQRSETELGVIKKIAYKDALTGVGSKYAYTEKENALNEEIAGGNVAEFAVVVCDVNGLKYVNDTLGHAAGDEHIKNACKLICDLYDHSPVFRIGGDEFVVILRGQDFDNRKEIFDALNRRVEENISCNEVVIAAGMAEYDAEDIQLHDTFHRADQRMYLRKTQLKQMGARSGR